MSGFLTERAYAGEISALRYNNEISKAITKCREAIEAYPESDFFYKIHGDLLFQNQQYFDAENAYIEQLKRIEEKPRLFRCFAKFYQRLENVLTEKQIEDYRQKLLALVENEEIGEKIHDELVAFLGIEFVTNREVRDILIASENDENIERVKEYLEASNSISILQCFIKYHTSSLNRSKCTQTEMYLITLAEKKELFESLLAYLGAIIKNSRHPNPTIIRALLRVCRKMGSYNYAESIIKINREFVEKSDFNIQYELVYYFQSVNNVDLLELTLKNMRSSASSSVPIAKTLYNFLLSLDRLEEAQTLYYHIEELLSRDTRRVKGEELETSQVVWQKLKDLISEQEHYRQMEALSELLKGFSHELGQPITNIRFSVQVQQMKLNNGDDISAGINDLFTLILSQTERIGTLIDRFRPMVSSKSTSSRFCLSNCAQQVFDDLSDRLAQRKITYETEINDDCYIFGDQVQFSQIFYNLALNAMQAMGENGKIKVLAKRQGNRIIIAFSDTGPGIPRENSQKIFQPFFTTKEPTSGNGGEGLGLFIVWNILKIFNGTIKLDRKESMGACFLMELPYCKEEKNE